MKFLKRPTFVFTLVILGGLAVFFITSLSYGPVTRAVPQGVSVLAIVLTLVLLVGETLPNIGRYFDAGYFSTLKVEESGLSATTGHSTKRLISTIGWALVFFLLVVFLGFFIATAVSVFAYLKFYRSISWLKSSLVGGVSGLLMYLVFGLVMKVWLFPGIVFGERIIF